MNVGTGAIQGCPGHDFRDFDFAKKFGLPIPRVVTGPKDQTGSINKKEDVVEHGGVMVNSDFLNGVPFVKAMQMTMDYFEKKGWGKRVVTYHLRDWIFSRQRYWGEPIPMVECKKCGWVPIPEDQLPVKLPYLNSYEPAGTGQSPLASVIDWVNVKCPTCNGFAKRETDTMPTWAGSCWHFLRFTDSKNNREAWSKEVLKKWLPVDWYIGGAEHAVLHLLYSRFWIKSLYDLGLVNFKEPFLRLRNVGVVIAEDKRKMSKSFGNIINPDDVVKEYGADTLRVYEMFMAPFNQQITWSTEALQGAYRFLVRVWKLYQKIKVKSEKLKVKEEPQLVTKLQKTIKKVSEDIRGIKMNTTIAAMMEFLNAWESSDTPHRWSTLSEEAAKDFLKLLAPFAPYMTEEIWRNVFGEKESIHLSKWPNVESEIIDEVVKIPVQVNGKLREILIVNSELLIDKNKIISLALKSEKVKKYLEGKKYKTIYVKGKILNFVLL